MEARSQGKMPDSRMRLKHYILKANNNWASFHLLLPESPHLKNERYIFMKINYYIITYFSRCSVFIQTSVVSFLAVRTATVEYG